MTEPHPSLEEPYRHPARMLASLHLGVAALSLLALLLILAGAFPLPEELRRGSVALILVVVAGLGAAYAVGRRGGFHFSALLTVGLTLASALFSMVRYPNSTLAPAFVVIGGLIGGLFLSTFATVLVFAATILLVSLIAPAVPTMTGTSYLTTIMLIVVVGLLMTIGALQREFRLAQLRSQADDLVDRQARLKQALRDVEDANQEINHSMQELRRLQSETGLLSEWSEMIHTSGQQADARPVIEHFAQRLFPSTEGALYLYDPARNELELQAGWGDRQHPDRIAPQACWAFRRGQVHRVGGSSERSGPLCEHLAEIAGRPTVCAPLIAHSELIGLLSLQLSSQTGDESLHIAVLAEEAARRVAVALANLRLREVLRDQSLRDPMTQLFNRRVMEEMLLREIRRSERNQRPFSVLMLDLDHFKAYNDDYGHLAGDLLLRHVAELLVSRIRGSDVACRYGGEELLVILVETGLEEALRKAEALGREIGMLQISYRGQLLRPVTCSIGVAVFPHHGATPDLLIHAADTALYRAKAAGRNCVRHLPLPEAA